MAPKGRRTQEGDGAKTDWGHPDAMPLSEVDENALYGGTITNVGPYGVFVNFGAVKDAILRVPGRVKPGTFRRGMEVQNLTVLSCDPEAGKVVLQMDGEDIPPVAAAPRPKRRAASSEPSVGGGPRRKEGGGARTRASSAQAVRRPKDWGHNEGTDLEDLEVGSYYDGTVTNVSPYGVFVDIGAVRDARLSVPTKIGRRFRIGDNVYSCKLEEVDVEKGRMSVSLENAEEVTADFPPKERSQRSQAKAKAKAKTAPRGKSRPRSAPRKAAPETEEDMAAIEDAIAYLEVGAYVDGVVSNRVPAGTFVDIGCGKDARLKAPKRILSRLRRGDEVKGMRIEVVDVEAHRITVAKEGNDEDEVDEEEEEVPRSRPKAGAKAKGKAKAKAEAKDGKDWSHPGATPLTRLKPGQVAHGVVTNIQRENVYVNFGAVRDGILKLPRQIARQFQVGDEVEGMTVESVDMDNSKVILRLEDPELEEPLPPAPSRSAAKQQARAKGKAKARAAAATSPAPARRGTSSSSPPPGRRGASSLPPESTRKTGTGAGKWTHPGARGLDELEPGEEVDGIVTNCGRYGVFLDIGAVKDGKLSVSNKDALKFRKYDKVEGLIIEHVDAQRNELQLKLTYELGDEPEEIVDNSPPQRRAAQALPRSGQPRRQSAPPGPARPRSRSPSAPPRPGVSGRGGGIGRGAGRAPPMRAQGRGGRR